MMTNIMIMMTTMMIHDDNNNGNVEIMFRDFFLQVRPKILRLRRKVEKSKLWHQHLRQQRWLWQFLCVLSQFTILLLLFLYKHWFFYLPFRLTFVGLMKIFRPKIEIFKMIFVQIEILGKEEQLKAREQELGEVGL